MDHSKLEAHVEILPSGRIRVAFASPEADPTRISARHRLILHGGSVEVDVHSGWSTPDLDIWDLDAAMWWVPGVFGDAFADQLLALATDPVAGQAHRALPFHPSALTDIVRRLALGRWLLRWWPSSRSGVPRLDVAILELELGGLTWQAEPCFAESQVAEALLAPNLRDWLDAKLLVTGLPEATQLAAQEVVDLAGRAILDVVDFDTPGFRDVVAVLDSPDGLREPSRRALASIVDAPETQVWKRGADRVLGSPTHKHEVALIAGEEGPLGLPALASGVATTDWAQVAPRLTSGAEDDLLWQVRPSNDELQIQVDLESGDSQGDLYARVYHARSTLPLALFKLERQGLLYTGFAALPLPPDAFDASELWVDAVSPGYAHPPRTSPDEVNHARARRDLIRTVLRNRSRVAADSLGGDRWYRAFIAEALPRRP